jgi:valyl-tRNA synthetase
MTTLNTYNPEEIECKWYQIWEQSGCFKPSGEQESYSIFLPPPNVTGTLHMGHGFQHTLMDALIRYHRMKGYNTLWQPGVDHAGIATQMVVERNLESEGLSRRSIGREAFLKKVWEWKNYSGDTITKQMRRLGASCDWTRERFTMDEVLSNAVKEVFVSLYADGLIYRGYRLVNWDVRRQTAVSDLEVKSIEENGHIWHIRYNVVDSNEYLIVATTRPETMLGDVAVAVNPNDERYQHLIGKKLHLPLVGRHIPIISDNYVDIEFGTGCVKITPAHDFNDYEIGLRHKLDPISIMTLDGKINDNAPIKYVGLDRFIARKQVLKDLEDLGLLVEVKVHKLMVPRGERDDVILEPMLTHQWFIDMKMMAQRGLQLVKEKQIEFVPQNWEVIYNQWLENIQDWCISRQLWWGHRIPAYYDDEGNIFVAKSYEEALKKSGKDKLHQDEDVLDTWFSSALWCFSTLDWPCKIEDINTYLPSNVLVTGFDIIFFWVARMVMFTDKFIGKVPFKHVYVTGLIQDANGNKMSKSKGNIIDPLDLIDGITLDELIKKRTANLMNPKQSDLIVKTTTKDYPNGFNRSGADALRYAFASLSSHGREIRFDIKRVDNARNFCNKIWNATKLVLMSVENNKDLITDDYLISGVDNWILIQLIQLIKDLEFAYTTYRFDVIAQRLYEFFWSDYCDWYLELAKINLMQVDINQKKSSLNTMLKVLEITLRLIHPIMPFITEELWQYVINYKQYNKVKLIMIANYPKVEDIKITNDIENINVLKDIVTSIRNLRAEMNVSPATKVPLEMIVSHNQLNYITSINHYIMGLGKITSIKYVDKLSRNDVASALVHNITIMLNIQIDKEAEENRINKELFKLDTEYQKIMLKLNNSNFIDRAPKDLVLKEQQRSQELMDKMNYFKQQLEILKQ